MKRGYSTVEEMNLYYKNNGWCVRVVPNEEGNFQTIVLPAKTRDRSAARWGEATEALEEIKNSDNKISYLHECQICGFLSYINRRTVTSNPGARRYHNEVGCPCCKEKDLIPEASLQNANSFYEHLKSEGVWKNFEIVKFEGFGRMARVNIKCLDCGTETEAEAYSFTGCHRHGCQGCNGQVITATEFSKRLRQERPDLIALDDFVNSTTPIKFECESGHSFIKSPNQVLSGCQCPSCGTKTESLMAQQVKKFCQDRYDSIGDSEVVWKIGGRNLRSDVWIEELSLWIEIHGMQHYKESGLYSADFEDLQLRDKMKVDFCIENGYNYIAFNQPMLQKYPAAWKKLLTVAMNKCLKNEPVFWIGESFDKICETLTKK